MRSLAGRTALVTGASRGIGEYIVEHLLREGMKVALAARSLDDLERVRTRLDPGGQRTAVFQCDVTDAQGCRATLAAAAEALGAIDVLVNNAGVEVLTPFADADLDEMRQIIDINVLGVLNMTHAALPELLGREEAHIVNIASLAGLTPVPYNAVYSASKHAIVGFSDSLRMELERTSVGVSSVCPGFVREAGMFNRHQEGAPAMAGTSSPDEVAAAVVKAIKGNRRSVVVAASTARLSPLLRAVAPGFYGRMFKLSGVHGALEQAARKAGARSKPGLS